MSRIPQNRTDYAMVIHNPHIPLILCEDYGIFKNLNRLCPDYEFVVLQEFIMCTKYAATRLFRYELRFHYVVVLA